VPARPSSPGRPPVLGNAPLPADLHERVGSTAAALAARGVVEGSRVAVEADEPTRTLAWLLGADVLGAATLVLEPRWTPAHRAAVLDDARPNLVVDEDVPVGGGSGAVGDEQTAFYLATTSGSTGAPAVLQRSRQSWLRSFAALGPVPGPVLIAGPLSSSLFLFGALHALWCGAELRLSPRWDAGEALAAGAVHVVPAMLAELVAAAERAPAALRTVVCGGAHLDPPLRRRFAAALPDTELVEYYGSAEHSLIAIRRDAGLRPVPGVDLDVREGTLWVRSPLAVDGRLRAGRLERAAEWTTVGDRVELRDGELTVLGRGDGVISCGGTLVVAEEVESVLRAAPRVDDVVVVGTPHARLGAVVTAVVQGTPALTDLRAAARDGLDPAKRPRRWLVTAALPRTASGKTARRTVVDALAAGTLDARPMT
jgi:long-chain acyl-CoA synthetase